MIDQIIIWFSKLFVNCHFNSYIMIKYNIFIVIDIVIHCHCHCYCCHSLSLSYIVHAEIGFTSKLISLTISKIIGVDEPL